MVNGDAQRSVAMQDSYRGASFCILYLSFTFFILLGSKGKCGCLGSSFIIHSLFFILHYRLPFLCYWVIKVNGDTQRSVVLQGSYRGAPFPILQSPFFIYHLSFTFLSQWVIKVSGDAQFTGWRQVLCRTPTGAWLCRDAAETLCPVGVLQRGFAL